MRQIAVDRIVFEQMSERRRIGNIVDRNDLELAVSESCTIEHAADTAEAVDSDPNRHR
jgi:hypothetical protein